MPHEQDGRGSADRAPFPNDRQDLARPGAGECRRSFCGRFIGGPAPFGSPCGRSRPGSSRRACSSSARCPPAAQDETGRRVDELVAAMTLEEKLGQLNLVSQGPPLRWDDIAEGRAGAFLNFNNAPDILRAQTLARTSRLKIPPLFGLDVLHGFRTQFPLPLGEAAAFNPDLSRRASEWAAREAASIGVQWTYAPMADLSRDIRWGRIVEGFGEDPYLGAVLTAARVKGFHDGGLATAVKHFAGYGAPQGGRDYDTTFIPPAEMYDIYLPSFRAAVEAGTESLMAAFNANNGVPSTANPWLLTDVLRRQWGFSGFVTSDWGGIHELIGHGVARDGAEAARKAILAGVDMDMMGQLYITHLPEEVRAGRVPESVVDEAVRRVLRTKMRMGLFDRPDVDPVAHGRGVSLGGIPQGRPRDRPRDPRAPARTAPAPCPSGRAPAPSRWWAPSRTRPATRSGRTRRGATRRTASPCCRASASAPRRPGSRSTTRRAATSSTSPGAGCGANMPASGTCSAAIRTGCRRPSRRRGSPTWSWRCSASRRNCRARPRRARG